MMDSAGGYANSRGLICKVKIVIRRAVWRGFWRHQQQIRGVLFAVENATAPRFPSTYQLYTSLLDRGFHTILITGSKNTSYVPTALNLARQNIVGFDQLILRAESEYEMTAAEYNSRRRHELEAKYGYKVVGCVGDQVSDCAGGATGVIGKLPNYAYYVA